MMTMPAEPVAAVEGRHCGTCTLCCKVFAIAELDKADVLDAIRMGFGDRKDDTFAELFFRLEDQFDMIPVGSGCAMTNPGTRGKPRRRINGQAAVGCECAGPKRQ